MYVRLRTLNISNNGPTVLFYAAYDFHQISQNLGLKNIFRNNKT